MRDFVQERILVLDFGSQYTQLIARRIREARVYSEIIDGGTPVAKIAAMRPAGLILSGGPASVHDAGAPGLDPGIFTLAVPILGICYGLQFVTRLTGGEVRRSGSREYGQASLTVKAPENPLFAGLPAAFQVWMSHADEVVKAPAGFQVIGSSLSVPCAAVHSPARHFWGVQFHPEVAHTRHGARIMRNFVRRICGCRGGWTPRAYIAEAVELIRRQVGDGGVVCGLSGGVDSAVAALLIHAAVGDQLTCIFVDNGLLRHEEALRLLKVFERNLQVKVVHVDAVRRFLDRLAGVSDPEEKRKIVGHQFIAVFEEAARTIPDTRFLAQGTLYPDVIESSGIGLHAEVIKSHHNVGGLPEKLGLDLVEPLRMLFKDEVRKVGLELGMSEEMVWRQPFPGPGLAVRVVGEITEAKLELLRAADRIVQQEMKAAGYYRKVWQSFAVLLPVRSVGVMGDGRTYEFTVALRAVQSSDGMTANWAPLPKRLLAAISSRITNEVRGVNRVVFDITSKPPGTIEWE